MCHEITSLLSRDTSLDLLTNGVSRAKRGFTKSRELLQGRVYTTSREELNDRQQVLDYLGHLVAPQLVTHLVTLREVS